MKNLQLLLVAALLFPSLAIGQKSNKHNDVPAVFGTAKTFFVESADGPLDKPGLNPAESQAITEAQDAILGWRR